MAFVAVLNRAGHCADTVASRLVSRLGGHPLVAASRDGACVVMVSDTPGGRARLLRSTHAARERIAVGDVRLDEPHAPKLRQSNEEPAGAESDLALESLGRVLHEGRAEDLARLSGEFAFAVYDAHRRELAAARDAFGVKALFYMEEGDHLLIASHASLLARGGYDPEYIALFLLGNVAATETTVHAGVQRLPAGGVLVASSGRQLRIGRYWAPRPSSDTPQRLPDAAERFRTRFTACVQARIASSTPVWSELSGGLDSSSIVVTAHHLASQGQAPALGGVLTYADALGEGDERSYAREVVDLTGVRQTVLANDWPWRDDGEPPPGVDEPTPFYPFFARDRLRARTVRIAGGEVLLSGLGSDHYLCGSLVWLADLVARGRLVAAAHGCADVAFRHRASMWGIARRYALAPLLPAAWRYRRAQAAERLPAWIPHAYARRHHLRERLSFMRIGRQGLPTRFQDGIAVELNAIEHAVRYKASGEPIELRFPFLDCELVELALGAPRTFLQEQGYDKILLREAMRGRLPESVRLRSTKGGIDARILWALTRERERIEVLLRQSCLADLGAVDIDVLRHALEHARRGHVINTAFLLTALALETWLAVRDGRWRVGRAACPDMCPDAA